MKKKRTTLADDEFWQLQADTKLSFKDKIRKTLKLVLADLILAAIMYIILLVIALAG